MVLYPLTTLFYLLIFFISSFLSYRYTKLEEKKSRNLTLCTLFLVLFIPAAIRYEIGTDYLMYQHFYEKIRGGGLISKEPGYILLMKLFIWLGVEFQVFVAFVAAVTYYFILAAFVKIPRKYSYLYIIFFVLTVYLVTYSSLRQSLAISAMNYALIIMPKKRIKGLYMAVFAISIHFSVALLLIVYAFRNIKLNYSILIVVLLVSALISFFFGISETVINQIPDWISYKHYLSGKFNRPADMDSGLGVLFVGILTSIPLFYAKCIIKKNNDNRLWMLFTFIFVYSVILSTEVYIFNRLRELFSMTIVLALTLTPEGISSRWQREAFVTIQVIFFFMMFFIAASTYYSFIEGGLGIVPYQSIFSK